MTPVFKNRPGYRLMPAQGGRVRRWKRVGEESPRQTRPRGRASLTAPRYLPRQEAAELGLSRLEDYGLDLAAQRTRMVGVMLADADAYIFDSDADRLAKLLAERGMDGTLPLVASLSIGPLGHWKAGASYNPGTHTIALSPKTTLLDNILATHQESFARVIPHEVAHAQVLILRNALGDVQPLRPEGEVAVAQDRALMQFDRAENSRTVRGTTDVWLPESGGLGNNFFSYLPPDIAALVEPAFTPEGKEVVRAAGESERIHYGIANYSERLTTLTEFANFKPELLDALDRATGSDTREAQAGYQDALDGLPAASEDLEYRYGYLLGEMGRRAPAPERSFAFKGRSGYVLKPSEKDPHKRRWQKVEAAGATKPRGRASATVEAIDRDLLEGYGWVGLADSEEFKNRLGPTLGDKYLENLVRASNGQRLGWHEDDYAEMDWGTPKQSTTQSVLFGNTARVDEDLLQALGVENPDQYAARMLGTALPFFALDHSPEDSWMVLSRHRDNGIMTRMALYGSDGKPRTALYRTFRLNPDSDLPSLSNEVFTISEPLQGYGLGSAAYASQSQYAKELGAAYIALVANMSVGGYSWPLLGYDFRFYDERAKALSRLTAHIRRLGRANHLNEAEVSALEDMSRNLRYAWDFARFNVPPEMGRDKKRGNPEWRKAGKHTMLKMQYPASRFLGERGAYNVMTDTIDRRLREAGLGGKSL